VHRVDRVDRRVSGSGQEICHAGYLQQGGQNYVGQLYLGRNAGSSGVYDLQTGLLQGDQVDVGWFGDGIFTQTGGTNTVTNALWIGDTSTGDGTYTLSSGQLDIVADIDAAGLSGSTSFDLDGGTLSVGGPLVRPGWGLIAFAPLLDISWSDRTSS